MYSSTVIFNSFPIKIPQQPYFFAITTVLATRHCIMAQNIGAYSCTERS